FIEPAPLQPLARLLAAAIGAAGLLALFLHPALATAVRLITLWDLLRLDLGPEPQAQIPLFAGLRRHETKIVALLARRETAPPGHYLSRRDERQNEVLVLLAGRADVS